MFSWNETIININKKRKLGLLPSVAQTSPNEIASLIEDFLNNYAVMNADYDPDFDDKEAQFASPDAANLFLAANLIREHQELPNNYLCQSSWERGGYAPYADTNAHEEHDAIIKLINTLLVN